MKHNTSKKKRIFRSALTLFLTAQLLMGQFFSDLEAVYASEIYQAEEQAGAEQTETEQTDQTGADGAEPVENGSDETADTETGLNTEIDPNTETGADTEQGNSENEGSDGEEIQDGTEAGAEEDSAEDGEENASENTESDTENSTEASALKTADASAGLTTAAETVEALNAQAGYTVAMEKDGIVLLLGDVTLSETLHFIAGEISIDLAGHTVSLQDADSSSAESTGTAGTTTSSMAGSSSAAEGLLFVNGAKLSVTSSSKEKGTLTSTGYVLKMESGSVQFGNLNTCSLDAWGISVNAVNSDGMQLTDCYVESMGCGLYLKTGADFSNSEQQYSLHNVKFSVTDTREADNYLTPYYGAVAIDTNPVESSQMESSQMESADAAALNLFMSLLAEGDQYIYEEETLYETAEYKQTETDSELTADAAVFCSAYDLTVSRKYAITTELSGGTFAEGQTMPESYMLTDGGVMLPVPVLEHFGFRGWYFDENLTKKVPFADNGTDQIINAEILQEAGVLAQTAESEQQETGASDQTDDAAQQEGYAGSFTLYAAWETDTCRISFNGNGATGGTMSSMTCDYGETCYLKSNMFTRTGYVFTGWNTKAEPTEEEMTNTLSDRAQYIYNDAGSTAVTLYAQWEATGLEISYDANGGTMGPEAASAMSEVIAYGNTYQVYNTDMKRTGYVFKGWNTKQNGKGTSYSLTKTYTNKAANGSSLTLYAQWTKAKYKIKYELDGGKNGSNKTSYTIDNSTITLKAASRSKSVFLGWYYDEACSEEKRVPETDDVQTIDVTALMEADALGDITLYAKWDSELVYQVVFDANGGFFTDLSLIAATDATAADAAATEAAAADTMATDTTATEAAAADATAADTTAADTTATDAMAADITAADATATDTTAADTTAAGQLSNVFSYEYAASYTAPAVTRTGYTLTGWTLRADGKGTKYKPGKNGTVTLKNLSKTDGASLTLYAQWSLTKYTITYKLNGGKNNSKNKKSFTGESGVLEIRPASRSYYKFDGWYYDEDFTDKALIDAETGYVTIDTGAQLAAETIGNITLYAKWTSNLTYQVAFDANGGTFQDDTLLPGGNGEVTDYADYEYTQTYTAPAVSRTGYTFTGWTTLENGKGKKYKPTKKGIVSLKNLTKISDEKVTLYAQWSRTTYKITYKLNGGKNSSKNVKKFTMDTGEMRFLAASKNYNYFDGWYLDASYTQKVEVDESTGEAVIDTASLVTEGTIANITLYAKWTPYTYTVRYHVNGGDRNISREEFNYGTKYYLSSDTSVLGYSLKGWNTREDGKGKLYKITSKISNLSKTDGAVIDLYAVWTKDTYKISYKLNGGTNGKGNVTSFKLESETITLKAPARKNYVFDGWYYDAGYTEERPGMTAQADGTTQINVAELLEKRDSVMNGKTLTLYAKWHIITYTVKLDLNNETYDNGVTAVNPEALADMTCFYNSSYELPEGNAMRYTGYEFKGWCTQKTTDTEGSVLYKPGATIKNLSKTDGDIITLYAVWGFAEPDTALGTVSKCEAMGTGTENNEITYTPSSNTADDTYSVVVTAEMERKYIQSEDYKYYLVAVNQNTDVIEYLIDVENAVPVEQSLIMGANTGTDADAPDADSTGTDAGTSDADSTGTDAGTSDADGTGTDAGTSDTDSTGTDAGTSDADGTGTGTDVASADSDTAEIGFEIKLSTQFSAYTDANGVARCDYKQCVAYPVSAKGEISSSTVFLRAFMNKYAVAVKKEDGTLTLVSDSRYVSYPENISYISEYDEGISKKGIQGIEAVCDGSNNSLITNDLGVGHVFVNVYASHVMEGATVTDAPKNQTGYYEYNGKFYYFPNGNNYLTAAKALNDAGISVTMQVMLDWSSCTKIMVNSKARSSGHTLYSWETTDQTSRETMEAMFCYLAETYGTMNPNMPGYVSDWILGNECNSYTAYQYKGSMSKTEFYQSYTQAYRAFYNAIKAVNGKARVSVCVDHCWNKADYGYSSRSFLDNCNTYFNQYDNTMDWNIAFHPYANPLTSVEFWNNSGISQSSSTSYINMYNIGVLTDYVSANYSSDTHDTPYIILSEQGYTSTGGQSVQAAALVYSYYIAACNPRITAFEMRSYVDDSNDGVLKLGLIDKSGTKKEAYNAYKYCNSAGDEAKTYMAGKEYYKKIKSSLSDWSSIVPGYDTGLIYQ